MIHPAADSSRPTTCWTCPAWTDAISEGQTECPRNLGPVLVGSARATWILIAAVLSIDSARC